MTDAPFGMLAELTHRCPLHCPYCSNPLELARREDEMTTEQWCRVFREAREAGVLQIHLSGGEPLLRADLPELVGCARDLGAYVSLVTSGLGLPTARAAELAARGLDHVQLSVQDADPEAADRIAGTRAHHHKRAAAAAVRAAGLPLTVNAVLHRANHDHIAGIVELAEEMGAERLELANTQYYGWALRNRAALLPTRAQLDAADRILRAARERLAGRLDIVYVLADLFEGRAKPCMHGWGSRQFTVTPDGYVLPCPAATVLRDLTFDNVLRRPLADIWYSSGSFNAFRGTGWMREPCRGCPRRDVDFGGCRCQAFVLTGDATATDPACSLSPHRGLVDTLLNTAPSDDATVFEMRGVMRGVRP